MDPITPLRIAAPGDQAKVDPPLSSAAAPPAHPGTSEWRGMAAAEVSAFFADDSDHSVVHWRRTIAFVRQTLATLERICEAKGETLKQQHDGAAAYAGRLVEKLASDAEIATEAAVNRTRAKADVDVAQMHAFVTHLEGESKVRREGVSRLQAQLETERARHARLTAAIKTVQRGISLAAPTSRNRTGTPGADRRQESD